MSSPFFGDAGRSMLNGSRDREMALWSVRNLIAPSRFRYRRTSFEYWYGDRRGALNEA